MESTRTSSQPSQPAQHTLLCNMVVAPASTYCALGLVANPIFRIFPYMTARSQVVGSMALALPLRPIINSLFERMIHGKPISSHPQHTRLCDIVIAPASTYTAWWIADTSLCRIFPYMADRRLAIGSVILSFPLTAPVRYIFENIVHKPS